MTERNGIYIIDLQQSLPTSTGAYAFIKETVAEGGTVSVGTKKQAQEAIAEQATRVGMPYVNQRRPRRSADQLPDRAPSGSPA